jgi:hypothetical protein
VKYARRKSLCTRRAGGTRPALRGKGGKVTRKQERGPKDILGTALVPVRTATFTIKLQEKIHNKMSSIKSNEKNKVNSKKRRTKV